MYKLPYSRVKHPSRIREERAEQPGRESRVLGNLVLEADTNSYSISKSAKQFFKRGAAYTGTAVYTVIAPPVAVGVGTVVGAGVATYMGARAAGAAGRHVGRHVVDTAIGGVAYRSARTGEYRQHDWSGRRVIWENAKRSSGLGVLAKPVGAAAGVARKRVHDRKAFIKKDYCRRMEYYHPNPEDSDASSMVTNIPGGAGGSHQENNGRSQLIDDSIVSSDSRSSRDLSAPGVSRAWSTSTTNTHRGSNGRGRR